MLKSKLAYIYVSFTVLLWASVAAVGKLLLEGMTSLQLIFYSFALSSVGLFVIVLIQGKFKLLLSYTKKDHAKMFPMAVLGVYAYFLFLYGALSLVSAQEAFIVNYLWPLMVVIFGVIILKEKMNFRKFLAIILGFFGVYIVVTKGALLAFRFTNLRADILAIFGAVSYGIFSVLGKKYNFERYTSMLIYYFYGFILMVPTLFLFSEIMIPTFNQFIGLVWIGFFTSALAYVFWFKALEYGDTAKMSNVVFLTPFISLVFIYFILGEEILASSIVGLIFILAGILIQSLRRSEKQIG